MLFPFISLLRYFQPMKRLINDNYDYDYELVFDVQQFDLSNIQVLKLTITSDHDVELTNRGDAITISGKGIFGHFHISVRYQVYN